MDFICSDESKARISYSLTRVWGKKLKWKRSRENFLSSWADSIAEAAKRGGSGQRELQWDSYGKIKEEIAIEQRHQSEARRRKRNIKSKEEQEQEELDIAQELKLNERLAKVRFLWNIRLESLQ